MKIRFLHTTPKSIAFGGQEVQAENLITHISKERPHWDVASIDYNKKESSADIYHLVGNSEFMLGIINFLPPTSKLVISAIHGTHHDKPYRKLIKSIYTSLGLLLKENTSYSNLRKLFVRANRILTLTQPGKDFIVSRYNIHPDVVQVVPNGVDPLFFKIPEQNNHHILVLGSIINRKSPLEVANFAKSKEGQKYSFHFIGCGLNNEQYYFTEFKKSIADAANISYYGNLDHHSDEFKRVFGNCSVLLQPSKAETQSLAALESMAAGKACVFLDRPYATTPPMSIWPRIKDFTPHAVDNAIQKAIQISKSSNMRTKVLTWSQVSQQVIKNYEDII